MKQRILLVEDEEHLLDGIKLNLEMEGYQVITAVNGREGFQKFKDQRFNLIILDVMMPELTGFQVAEMIRLEDTTVPILFLTAKNTTEDKITGLKKGGDDYLTKPFNLEELMLRVGILIKRGFNTDEKAEHLNIYTIADCKINFNSYEVIKGEELITTLTKKEVMLLRLLIERKGEVVSRNDILKTVWNYDVLPSTRTIDNFIMNFRKYFEIDPKNPVYFHSIRGVGYKFVD